MKWYRQKPTVFLSGKTSSSGSLSLNRERESAGEKMAGEPGIPKSVTDQIREICRQIDETQEPYFVPVRPEPDSQIEECFFNVKTKVEKDGGRIQFGWALWKWPHVMVWADFHAIWISPEGERIDVTPVPSFDRMLFLPDSTQEYDYARSYYRVPLKYFPISDNPVVLEYIALKQELFNIEEEHSPGQDLCLEGPALNRWQEVKQKIVQVGLQLASQSQPMHSKTRRKPPHLLTKFKKYRGR